MVECDLAKVDVAGSNPVSRSNFRFASGLASFGGSVKSFKSGVRVPRGRSKDLDVAAAMSCHFRGEKAGFRVHGRCGSLDGGWLSFTTASTISRPKTASSRLKQQAAVSDWVHRPRGRCVAAGGRVDSPPVHCRRNGHPTKLANQASPNQVSGRISSGPKSTAGAVAKW